MSDLIERLRGWEPFPLPLYSEAADEIERLRKLVNTAAEVTEDYERKLSKCERELAEAKAAFNTLDELKSRVDTRLDWVERELAEARGLLRESVPFIGWGSRPDGLVERVEAFLAADQPTGGEK